MILHGCGTWRVNYHLPLYARSEKSLYRWIRGATAGGLRTAQHRTRDLAGSAISDRFDASAHPSAAPDGVHRHRRASRRACCGLGYIPH